MWLLTRSHNMINDSLMCKFGYDNDFLRICNDLSLSYANPGNNASGFYNELVFQISDIPSEFAGILFLANITHH